MKLNDEELKSLWQQDTRQATGSRQDCLSFELLVRAGEGKLHQAEREPVAGHLAVCADCAEEYRIALSVNEWAAQPATHRPLAPALVGQTTTQENWRRGWASQLKRLTSLSPLAMATAALFVVILLLGVWLLDLRHQNRMLVAQLNQQRDEFAESEPPNKDAEDSQSPRSEVSAPPAGQEDLKAENQKLKKELADLSQPQLDLPQIDVDPNGETRGSSSSVRDSIITFNVPSAASSFTINSPGAGSKPFAHYMIELIDAKTNKVVWSGQRRRDKETTFTLTLAKRGIPAGQYRIRVYGLDGQGKQLLSNYEINVKYPTRTAQ